MALQTIYEVPGKGYTLPEAYIRIESFQSDLKGNITLHIEVYGNQAARTNGLFPAHTAELNLTDKQVYWIATIDTQGGNSAASLYGYLKEQSEFENAIDV